ncbi:MAG: hypothetical protein HYY84_12960 [Deltaproteobacteria bacterium]|nr:hypothetical protein [Deltaproteobacteria bacterium]
MTPNAREDNSCEKWHPLIMVKGCYLFAEDKVAREDRARARKKIRDEAEAYLMGNLKSLNPVVFERVFDEWCADDLAITNEHLKGLLDLYKAELRYVAKLRHQIEISSPVRERGDSNEGVSSSTPKQVVVGERRFDRLAQPIGATPNARPRHAVSSGNPWIGRDRINALKPLFGLRASQTGEVIAFRKRHLMRGLIDRENFVDWVRAAAKRDGAARATTRIVLSKGTTWRETSSGKIVPNRNVEANCFLEVPSVESLKFNVGGLQGDLEIPIAPGGKLDALRRVGVTLANLFPWRFIDALVFVVTGRVPNPVSIGHTIVRSTGPSVLTRLVLNLDPLCAINEVTTYFINARKMLLKGRKRRQGNRSLALANYVLGQIDSLNLPKGPGARRRWNALQKGWEKAHPTEPKKAPRLFRRYCRMSIERALNPIEWKRQKNQPQVVFVRRR